jgi:putative DNA primase/helicase
MEVYTDDPPGGNAPIGGGCAHRRLPRGLHDSVKASRAAGISIHPPTEDGVKKPLGSWADHQREHASPDQVKRWYGPMTGLGWICGAVSGNLEVLEFDCSETYHAYKAAAQSVGLGDLVERIEGGYLESSPGGGFHWPYYTGEVRGNTKLAQRPGPPEPDTGRPTVETLIETRGEGGYIIVAPSNGKVHPTGGQYRLERGAIETIATLTSEERESLWELARTFDRMPEHPEGPGTVMSGPPRPARPSGEGLRPGDDYNAQATWDDVLAQRGWTKLYTRAGITYWRRPGKSEGWSATTNVHGSDLLYVFSSSTEFEPHRTYDKFGAYAILEAGGNLVSAAKTLADQGYGSKAKAYRPGRNGRPHTAEPRMPPPTAGPPPATSEEPEGPRPNESVGDPHRLARLYRDEYCSHPDGPTLAYHRGQFHLWEDGFYREVPEKENRADLARAIKVEFDRINVAQLVKLGGMPRPEPAGGGYDTGKEEGPPKVAKVTSSLVNNVSLALAGDTLLSGRVDVPAWLCPDPPWPAREILPARNGLLHLPSFCDRKPAFFIPPTPAFFCPYATGYDFDPRAPEPANWLELIHGQYWPGDPESVMLLQEWFGYHLTPDTTQQKILTMIGPKRCGKGTVAKVLSSLIGAWNVCNPTLSQLGTQFGSAVLIGKLAAIITDAQLSGRADLAQIVENLLAISGEDSRTISRKHLPDWNGRLMLKFTIITNDNLALPNASGALVGRMKILRFTRSFFGQEDTKLFQEKLLPEMPGILLWAIQGWKRLQERGHFIQPDSGKELLEEMEALSSPVQAFVNECCIVGPGHSVEVNRLFAAWVQWCQEMNRDNVGTKPTFGRNLGSVIPNLKVTQPRLNGARARCYEGLDLLPPEF